MRLICRWHGLFPLQPTFHCLFHSNAETPLPGGPLGRLFCATYLPLAGGFREACPTKPVGLLLGDAGGWGWG